MDAPDASASNFAGDSTRPALHARRAFLRYLLASPALAGLDAALPGLALGQARDEDIITSVDQALDVFDFERVARQKVPPAHWGYLATGVDGEQTLAANRTGFSKYSLRVRRLVDVSSLDTRVTLFGTTWDSPIFLCPVSSQRAFHQEGELASARAAQAVGHLQILSTYSSHSIEKVVEAHGGSGVWYQLYATDQWDVNAALLARVRAAGVKVLVWTVDLNGGSYRETAARGKRTEQRDCVSCHGPEPERNYLQRKPMFQGIDTSHVHPGPQAFSWQTLQRLRELWPHTLLLKGIVSREDAELAVRYGVDGVVVSNHGGRAEESGRGTIESLPEVVAGVKHKIPVLVDSGFRRGTDIFKALALGATAVGIGRPYIWGLASFGQPGVEAVLRILRRELGIVLRQVGVRNLSEISPRALVSEVARSG